MHRGFDLCGGASLGRRSDLITPSGNSGPAKIGQRSKRDRMINRISGLAVVFYVMCPRYKLSAAEGARATPLRPLRRRNTVFFMARSEGFFALKLSTRGKHPAGVDFSSYYEAL